MCLQSVHNHLIFIAFTVYQVLVAICKKFVFASDNFGIYLFKNFLISDAGFSLRAGSWRNSPAIPHELTAYLIEKLAHIL